ncbi:UPF0389 protein CG9231 [Battus philenor]|uniref:UPF0389 protein CG9231 n=1 Tax=Battus philenor TaxID=42288 RepID=UPI0035CEE151
MNKLFLNRAKTLLLRRWMCTPATGANPPPDDRSMTRRHKPSDFEKTILVWTKKYKNKSEIPAFVSAEIIDRSRSEARIKISNVLMVLTALASLGAIIAGKAAAKRGESVHQYNLDWHKKYREEHAAKTDQTSSTN